MVPLTARVEINSEERSDGMARVLEMQLSRGIGTLVNEIVVDKIMEILGGTVGGGGIDDDVMSEGFIGGDADIDGCDGCGVNRRSGSKVWHFDNV